MRLGAAEIRFTTTADGDFSPPVAADDAALSARRRAVVAQPWTWLRQVHGSRVVTVDHAGAAQGEVADAALAVVQHAPVAVVTADCAPVVCVDDAGSSVAVIHAGWRGLVGGVVDATVAAMRSRGASTITAALGPCIHAECYEFAGDELEQVESLFGSNVRAVTSRGTPALNMPAAVRVALDQAGVQLVHDEDQCTACGGSHWSHRARGDKQRQATVAWLA